MVKDCCLSSIKDKKCIRKNDKKIFKLPRKFPLEECNNPQGFSMKSSCAPYKNCYKTKKKGKTKKKQKGGNKKTKKKEFLFNPNNPNKSFDVYIDKNPNDTIPIQFKTLNDVKNTIKKLEKLYKNKKYTHKRIWQVGMIMYVRLKVLKDKKPQQYSLSKRYHKHLGNRSKIKNKNKKKEFQLRKQFIFKI